MLRGNLFLLAVFGNIFAFDEIPGLSRKVTNAIAASYNHESIHNTQVYENISMDDRTAGSVR